MEGDGGVVVPLTAEDRREWPGGLASAGAEGRFSNKYCAYVKNDVTVIYGSVFGGRVARTCFVAARRSS